MHFFLFLGDFSGKSNLEVDDSKEHLVDDVFMDEITK